MISVKKIIRPLLILAVFVLLISTASVAASSFSCETGRHDFSEIYRTPPTHTSNGRVVLECRLCGARSYRVLFATGCNWGEWSTIRQPTCTQPGLKVRTCSVGVTHNEYEEIPALGHQWVETIIEPTCTEPGRRIRICSRCGESYTEVYREPLGKNYIEAIAREPSCEQDGERTFTCEHCGDYYTESIPALEHEFGEWIIYTPAKEGIEGRKYRECLICAERIWETIAQLPIVPSEPQPELEPRRFFGKEEAIITLANIAILTIGFLVLFIEFFFEAWRRRKIKELKKLNKIEESGEDGYEFI